MLIGLLTLIYHPVLIAFGRIGYLASQEVTAHVACGLSQYLIPIVMIVRNRVSVYLCAVWRDLHGDCS